MKRSVWQRGVIWAVAVAAFASPALSTAAVGESPGPHAAFRPATIAGHWLGRWENESVGTSGAVRGWVKKLPHERMGITVDFGGPLFGCGDPPPFSFSAPHIQHPGKLTARLASGWTSAGFSVATSTKVVGRFRATYEVKNGSLVIEGSEPLCNRSVSFRAHGHLSATRARLATTLEDESGVEKGTIIVRKSN
jgi:hypothetical protein